MLEPTGAISHTDHQAKENVARLLRSTVAAVVIQHLFDLDHCADELRLELDIPYTKFMISKAKRP